MASNSHQTAGNDVGNHTSVHTPSGRLETTCCDPLQNATSDGGNEGGIFPGNHHHDAIKADPSLPAHPHIQSDFKFPHHQNSSHQANQPRQIPVRVEGGDVSKKGFQIHREEIRSLYLDQNLTLHEVMEHMRRKGFRAT
ncbi:hypothetical protein PFICI_11137 [Pestalotiopsis fici W106-1]|uniref:Clr5 domain-containing protein n=1 Tax=Pestalotiopsis fici (strain W106-1 / CGMCC3.15140) TaxID=1229662 RepID=W3WTS6_PESFW|nr:uncharacterized protein PFICI_11137 [Pestalotiopsis fici W106-1]ETS77263.1 hypothetical protein PFICI_11137 [Pestalotiopsis fici W106-1]